MGCGVLYKANERSARLAYDKTFGPQGLPWTEELKDLGIDEEFWDDPMLIPFPREGRIGVNFPN